jgi:predicted PurR-regulated permease PerM
MRTVAFTRVQNTIFFSLLAGVSAAFIWLVQDYLFPIIWAIVLALLFHPLYTRITHRVYGKRTLAAALTMVVAVLSVFAPISIVGTIVAQEGIVLYQSIEGGAFDHYVTSLSQQPLVAKGLIAVNTTPEELRTSFADIIKSGSSVIATGALSAGAQIVQFAAKTLVMLYLLFFFLRDGTLIGARLMRVLPLGDTRELFLFERFTSTVRAIAKGSLVVALAQGAVGGLLFAIAGVSNPVLWAALMTLLALIPAAGPAVVWLPTGIIMIILGHLGSGITILVGGTLIIALLDNLLRPILVGKDTGMPDALILLSVLGGLSVFGLSGIVLGPVLAALFLALWELFTDEFHDELIARG